MILFIDSSALLKRYIEEDGSKSVVELMDKAQKIVIASITKLECLSAIRRMLVELRITKNEYIKLKEEMLYELEETIELPFDKQVKEKAIEIIEIHQLKTLDAIQLSSCIIQKDVIENFVCCDTKLVKAAKKSGLKAINPLD